jgi:hypothetical protein
MGSPPPPRRLHGLEVFRSPARRGPRTTAPPPGLARFQEPSARPVPDPKVPDCPSWGCFRPSTTRRSGPLHPGLPHLARSVLEVRASSTVCSLMRVRVPEGTLAVRGVRSQDTLCAVGCASVATAAVRIGQSCVRVSAPAGRLARTLVARHACGARCAPSSSSEEPRGRGPLRHAVGRSVPWAGSRGPGGQEAVLTFR